MAMMQTSEMIEHVCRTVLRWEGAELSDGQLLERFLHDRDEASFTALVKRHGPMVWGVCRRILRSQHDAEDAFQATFLVLLRKAASIVPREMVANWLYGVAYQTARKAGAMAAKKQQREKQVLHMFDPTTLDPEIWNDLQPVLDLELSRLPEKYRAAIVVCDLKGKSRKEAAQTLGVPEGTVAGRLARARAMLAKRLSRHGIAVSAGALAVSLAQTRALASVPNELVTSTMDAVAVFGVGQAAAGTMISSNVATLTDGVLKAMWISKFKTITAFVAVFGLLIAGGDTFVRHVLPSPVTVASAAQRPVGDPKAKEEPKRRPAPAADGLTAAGELERVDADKNTITISTFSRRDEKASNKTYDVAKDAAITQDGGKVKLADLKIGFRAKLGLSADQKSVVSISVDGGTMQGQFKSANPDRNTIVVIAGRDMTGRVLHLIKETKITLEGGKEGTIKDLKAGEHLLLTLSVQDSNTVMRIQLAPQRDK